jgi:hypothetical protein
MCHRPTVATCDEAKGEETRGVAAPTAQRSAQVRARRPSPEGLARRALMEAAGIEPASADAPDRTSTSVVRALASTAGRRRTPYRRSSHP